MIKVKTNNGIQVNAAKNLTPGDFIYSQLPIAAVPSDPKKCINCCKDGTLKCKCSARYCSLACQKQDFKIHKLECAKLQKFNVRFILRILYSIFLNSETCKGLGKEIDERFDNFGIGGLVANYDDFPHSKIQEFEAMAEYIATITEKKHLIEEFNIVLLMCISSCNSMTVSDQDGDIGGAIYDQLCLINHSCNPNACIVFDGFKASLYATRYYLVKDRNIKIDEEINISYVDLSAKKERQAHLRNVYYFDCNCSYCIEDPLGYLRCPECTGDVSSINYTCLQCTAKITSEFRISTYKFIKLDIANITYQELGQTYCRAKIILSISHQFLLTVMNAYYQRSLDLTIWTSALVVAIDIYDALKKVYGDCHYRLAIQATVIFRLAIEVGEADVATKYGSKALILLNIFDPQSKFFKKLMYEFQTYEAHRPQ